MSKTLILRPSRLLILPLAVAFLPVAAVSVILASTVDQTTWQIAVPLVVLGFFALLLYRAVRRLANETYHISDHSIQIVTAGEDITISLVNITEVTSHPHWQLLFTRYGSIVLYANNRSHTMIGINDAPATASIIRLAVEAAIAGASRRTEPPRFTPPVYAPGTLEPMNDLVGLWQQGMLTDEEYNREMERMKRGRG